MLRRLNKTTLDEALCIFDFAAGCKITKKIIMQKFRKLVLLHHPDKGGDAKIFSKIVEAKEVLIRDLDSIGTITTPDGKRKIVKSVGSVFVDWLKVADIKGKQNPFTTYRKGRTRR